MRLAIIFILLFTIDHYCQFEDIVCDSIFSTYNGCYTVEKVPEVVGGLDSLLSRMTYPSKALDNKIEGKVYVLVIIDSTGALLCSKVIKGIGYGCDEEALSLVRTSKFKPAISRGKPYTMLLSISIKFVLPLK